MPYATRLNDNSTGHDACVPMPLITGSPDVFINGLPAGRQTDKYDTHGCVAHSPHNDTIIGGSATVKINGLPAGRIGDVVNIAGAVAAGSPDVRIGG